MGKKKIYNDTEEWFKLIPELKEWNNGKGIDHEDWIGIEGKIEYALAYTSIFWPEFVLFNECIFIEEMNNETFEGWHKNCNGNLKSVEATINHRHIDDWFDGKCTREQIEYFSGVLKGMWESKLVKQFPCKQVTVDLSEHVGKYTITVYQENH